MLHQNTTANEFHFGNAELADSSEWILPVVKNEIRGLPAGSVVADLGCGNGSMLGQLRELKFELHGLDMSQSGIVRAQQAYPGVHFSCADLTGDLSDHSLAGKCDVVVSTEVVEHVFLPRRLASNCYLMLRSGGRLVMSTPYHGYLKNLALAITGKMEPHFTALWDYGHIKFWSKRTLSQLLEEAGFSIEHFRCVGRMPYLWKSMIVVAQKP
jgi:2-polyprenyl-6-hydroxyphenyl methylase/3-demethylubiquinone-9 3-methyltransferase